MPNRYEPTGRFERFLFSIMGPAQIGDPNGPVTFRAAPEAALCEKCGQPYDSHERIHGNVTHLACPA